MGRDGVRNDMAKRVEVAGKSQAPGSQVGTIRAGVRDEAE
jgi:hypothetical protein